MKKFGLAIRDSLHHWPMLLLATLCSLGVATLWSANIGAMYPVIEMTLQGNSMQKQLTKTVTETEAHVVELTEAIARVKKRRSTTQPPTASLRASCSRILKQRRKSNKRRSVGKSGA